MPPPSIGGDFLLWIDPDGSRHFGRADGHDRVRLRQHAHHRRRAPLGLHGRERGRGRASAVGRQERGHRGHSLRHARGGDPRHVLRRSAGSRAPRPTPAGATRAGGSLVAARCDTNYIHDSQTYSQGGGGYGLTLDAYTSDTLVENNIIYFFNKPFLFRASGGGNVVAYNYIDGGQDSASPTWMEPDIDSHMVYSHMELVEGNLCRRHRPHQHLGRRRPVHLLPEPRARAAPGPSAHRRAVRRTRRPSR